MVAWNDESTRTITVTLKEKDIAALAHFMQFLESYRIPRGSERAIKNIYYAIDLAKKN